MVASNGSISVLYIRDAIISNTAYTREANPAKLLRLADFLWMVICALNV